MTRPGLPPVALVALAIACSGAVAGALTANDFKGKNVVLFLSDQVSVCISAELLVLSTARSLCSISVRAIQRRRPSASI